MSQTSRTVVALVIGVALAGTLAACGQSEAVDPQTQRALDSVLSADDFPAGYTVVEFGKDAENAITEQLDDSRKGAVVTPAHCVPDAVAPDTAKTGRVVASNEQQATLSESVAVSGDDAASLAEAVTGECGRVRVEVTSGAASGTIVDIAQTDVSTPTVGGHRGLVFRQVSTVAGSDGDRRELIIGRVPVGGYLVTVQAVNADGTAPNRDSFDETLTAAVRKVAERRSHAP